MERLKEIMEKGADSATPEDIPIGLGVVTEFMNENTEAQNLIKDFNLTGLFVLKDNDNYILTIANGKGEYAQKSDDDVDFKLFTTLKSLAEILIGQTDVSLSFIKGNIEVEGDFGKMVDFFEVIELFYDKSEWIEKTEQEGLLDSATMRKFYSLYKEIEEDENFDIDPNDIPLIFDIFTVFANQNKDAKEVLEDEEYCVQMLIKDVGAYVITLKDGITSWSDVRIDDPTLQFEIGLNTAARVFLSGDAASAFLAGEIEASGNIAEALVLNDLIETLLDLLPFTAKDDD